EQSAQACLHVGRGSPAVRDGVQSRDPAGEGEEILRCERERREVNYRGCRVATGASRKEDTACQGLVLGNTLRTVEEIRGAADVERRSDHAVPVIDVVDDFTEDVVGGPPRTVAK